MLSLSGMSSLSSTGKTRVGGAVMGGLIPATAVEDKFGVHLDASIAVDAPPSCRQPRVAECRVA
jgi:hypothetical protein